MFLYVIKVPVKTFIPKRDDIKESEVMTILVVVINPVSWPAIEQWTWVSQQVLFRLVQISEICNEENNISKNYAVENK